MLVDFAMEMKSEGVFGSRMTGGGFGGCTVTLLKASAVDKVIQRVYAKYSAQGHSATFFVCPSSDGAGKIDL
jgi:galactokinase